MTSRLKPLRAKIGKPTRIHRQVDLENDENADPMGDGEVPGLDKLSLEEFPQHSSDRSPTDLKSSSSRTSSQYQQGDAFSHRNSIENNQTYDQSTQSNRQSNSRYTMHNDEEESHRQQSQQQVSGSSSRPSPTQDNGADPYTPGGSNDPSRSGQTRSSHHQNPSLPTTPTVSRNNHTTMTDDASSAPNSLAQPTPQVPHSSSQQRRQPTSLSSHRPTQHYHETGHHQQPQQQQQRTPNPNPQAGIPPTPTLSKHLPAPTPTLSNHRPQPTSLPRDQDDHRGQYRQNQQNGHQSSSNGQNGQNDNEIAGNDVMYKKVCINKVSYTILKTLGKGGSGKVYQAIRDDMGSMCAIKEIDLNVDMNTESAIRDEISLLQTLSRSPRVIKLLDQQARFDINIWYIVLELGSNDFGHILSQALQQYKSNYQLQQQAANLPTSNIPHCGGLTVTQLAHFWEQILSGVQTCHDINILHLDLKPANFVMVDGSMKLIDFGIAKAKHAEYTSVIQSNIMGTISYISPEQLASIEQKGAKVRPSSDVWALGCIFHQMVFGYTPYAEHKQAFQRIAAISSPQAYNPPQIPAFISGGDAELEGLVTDVLLKCLQKDPKNRPTVQELLLHPFLCPHSRKDEKYKHLFQNSSQNAEIDQTRVLIALKNVMKDQMDLYKSKDAEKPNVLSKDLIAQLAGNGTWKILGDLLTTQLNADLNQ